MKGNQSSKELAAVELTKIALASGGRAINEETIAELYRFFYRVVCSASNGEPETGGHGDEKGSD